MSETTLEAYIRQLLRSHNGPDMTIGWQGAEPKLMTLEFFGRALALVENAYRLSVGAYELDP
jgi:uncharacterized protein